MLLPAWCRVLACLLAAVPWLNPLAGGPSPSIQPWLVSAACGLALWLLAGGALQGARPRLLASALALVLWAVLSQQGLRPETTFLAAGLLLIVVATGATQHPVVVEGAQLGLLAAAATSAVLGLLQYFGWSEALGPLVSRANAGEAFANLRQPNQYATLTWLGAAVLLFGTVRVKSPLAFAVIVLLAAGSAASVSRTGALQGFMLTVLAAWWNGPQRRARLLLCAAAAFAYFAAAWLLPMLLEASGALPHRTLWGRIGADDGCGSRVVLWGNVLHLISLMPITGWGWGELDYAHFMTLYEGRRFCDILDNAHNLPLHLAVELGLPVAVLVCGGAALWAWRQRPWSEAVPQRRLAWALLAVILLHSLLEYPLWYGPFQLAFGFALGLLLPAAAGAEAARRPAQAMALGGLLLAGTAYAAWDYERVTQIYRSPDERRVAWRDNTLDFVRRSWLFSGPGRFAELTLTPVTRDNAQSMHALADSMLHYSPEPRVVEKLVTSSALLGRDREAAVHLARFRAAFPEAYREWRERQLAAPTRPAP